MPVRWAWGGEARRRSAIALAAIAIAVVPGCAATPEPPPGPAPADAAALGALESAFWCCDYVATTHGVLAAPMAACQFATRELKDRKFGGSSRALTAWWEENIAVPPIYTGFVTPGPEPGARRRLRAALGLAEQDRLIVASAGGGSVGAPLLHAVTAAFGRLDSGRALRLHVFTGPFLPPEDFERLRRTAAAGVQVARFTPDFLSHLAAADLSISMAGYNTTMNLLAARVPALVWPFGQNREQRLRAQRLEARGALRLLTDAELEPARLAAVVQPMLANSERRDCGVDLNGASATAAWVDRWAAAAGAGGPP